MPHDKHGTALSVGDVVSINAKITAIHEGDEYCNLSLETMEPMFPSNNKSALSLNAKQVVKPLGETSGPGAPAPPPVPPDEP